MKKTPDVVHDELVTHDKGGGICSVPFTGGTNSTFGSTYPPRRANTTPLGNNPLKFEKRIHSLAALKQELGMKKGDLVWAYSSMYDKWFWGEVAGENQVAIEIHSTSYKHQQEDENKKGHVFNVKPDGYFYSSRLSKEFTKTY